MKTEAYSYYKKLSEDSWYHQYKKQLIFDLIKRYSLIPKNILEIGCAYGSNLIYLTRKFPDANISGIDVNKEVVAYCKKERLSVSQEDIEHPSKKILLKRYDFILCSDVLEHTEHELSLNSINRLLEKEEHLLIQVPAFKCLWGDNDVLGMHKRRYTISSLKNILRKKGFEPVFINYFNFFAFFPYYFMNFLQRKKKENNKKMHVGPKYLNNTFFRISKIDRKLVLTCKLPFGVNILCLAKKIREL